MTLSYDDLITAATIGVGQRPIPVTDLAGPAGAHADVLAADPAVAVLDAAALLDAARRAGGLVLVPAGLPEPAPDDAAPELSPTAGSLLRDVLARGDRDLAAELLAATAAAGFRGRAPDLPDLLAAAVRDTSLRAPVAAVLGARGHWLAAHRPDWLRVADAEVAAPGDDAWAAGRLAERVSWLTALRERDPAAARELLAAGWARETGADRVELLGVLAVGLDAADEAFLEDALDDRKAEVRQRAARLLATQPGSAFAARATARARDVLSLERRGRRRRLVVTLPDEPDDAAQRDGLTRRSPGNRLGERAWHLVQVIAAAPLTMWPPRLGADPATLADLEITGEFGPEVHTGWRLAAERARDAEWAQALLTTKRHEYRGPFTPSDDRLFELLPPTARVGRAIAGLRDNSNPALVLGCAVPWPAELTDAVLANMTGRLRTAEPGTPGNVVAALGRGIDLGDPRDHVAFLHTLADRFRARTAEVPAAGRWPAALDRAAATLDLRRRFHRELH